MSEQSARGQFGIGEVLAQLQPGTGAQQALVDAGAVHADLPVDRLGDELVVVVVHDDAYLDAIDLDFHDP